MLIDFREHPHGQEIRADVCILGSGAAGITLARELDGSGLDVVILAGGAARHDPACEALYRSDVVGLKHEGVHNGRARVHGGTTTLWAGQALTFDPIDFERRDWVPHSGWPFDRASLDPYYRRANDVMQVETIAHDATSWPANRPGPPAFDPELLHPRLSQFTGQPDFAIKYGALLERSANVRVLIHAHAVDLVTNPEGTRLDRVEAKSLTGRTASVRARQTVVCCGAIESARLLLNSTSADPRGVGNANDLVGRFFQEHMQGRLAVIEPTDRKDLRARLDPFAHRGTRHAPKICSAEALQRREKILNVYGDLCYETREDAAISSAKLIARAIRRPELRKEVPGALVQVAKRPLHVVSAATRYALFRTPLFSGQGTMFLGVQSEQAPNPDSRVTLGDERDALGLRRTVLDWRVTELDRHTLATYVRVVAGEFQRLGLGKVDLETFHLPGSLDEMDRLITDCAHHIGTTRMHDDPKQGVVDRECRVHGIGNLSIGSTSVLPTGGASNPTLTMLALCFKIADRIKRELAEVPALEGAISE